MTRIKEFDNTSPPNTKLNQIIDTIFPDCKNIEENTIGYIITYDNIIFMFQDKHNISSFSSKLNKSNITIVHQYKITFPEFLKYYEITVNNIEKFNINNLLDFKDRYIEINIPDAILMVYSITKGNFLNVFKSKYLLYAELCNSYNNLIRYLNKR